MKKNGMTLIELLAVIAIIAIITVMIAPDIVNVRERSIKSTLKNKITRIENAALRYANDNISSVPSNFTANLDYTTDNSKDCIKTKKTKLTNGFDCSQFCLRTNVNSLIQNGYLSGDNEDGTAITHPLTNAEMNDQTVCVRYTSKRITSGKTDNTLLRETDTGRKLIAYILDEEELFDEFSE